MANKTTVEDTSVTGFKRKKEFINNACFRNTSNHWREILSLENRQITREPLNLSVLLLEM